jgi:hypothetical protein
LLDNEILVVVLWSVNVFSFILVVQKIFFLLQFKRFMVGGKEKFSYFIFCIFMSKNH